jgi:L-2,4-diaminobutyrate decarboxylase
MTGVCASVIQGQEPKSPKPELTIMNYREIVAKLRQAFPHPVRDVTQDEYLLSTFRQALSQATDLKGESPILGERESLTPFYKASSSKQLASDPSNVERVTRLLVNYLEGMTIWGHPRTQENVIPPPTIPSLVGMLLAGLYNPIIAWDEYSHKVALAEKEVVAIMSNLIGYNASDASGLFTFGGTGTMLYAVKVAIEKAFGNFDEHCKLQTATMAVGLKNCNGVIFTSEHSHYCVETVAGWLGLGTDCVVKIPGNRKHEMQIDVLRQAAYLTTGTNGSNGLDLSNVLGEKAVRFLTGKPKIIAIIATMGTTDHFGVDDLKQIVELRDELANSLKQGPFVPHIHADAVIGWAWAAFNDYFGPDEDDDALELKKHGKSIYRNLVFVSRKMKELSEADSIGVDFHKTGFAPCASSVVLFKNEISKRNPAIIDDLNLLRRDPSKVPYLFHFGDYHPGEYSLETTRSGAGVLSALANLKLFGREGLQSVLAYLIEMRQRLCDKLQENAHITVLNYENYGTVTLFRVYPDAVHTPIIETELTEVANRDLLLYHNAYNICIEQYLHKAAMAGRGVVISRTDRYRGTGYTDRHFGRELPLVALKSYILSPFVNERSVDEVVENVLLARERIKPDEIRSATEQFLHRAFSGSMQADLATEVGKVMEAAQNPLKKTLKAGNK